VSLTSWFVSGKVHAVSPGDETSEERERVLEIQNQQYDRGRLRCPDDLAGVLVAPIASRESFNDAASSDLDLAMTVSNRQQFISIVNAG